MEALRAETREAARFTTAVPKGAHRIKTIFRVSELIWNTVNIIFVFTKVFEARNRFCLYLAEKVNADVGRIGFKRDFLCWRGRESGGRYECRVAGTSRRGARIEFESEGVDASAEVAEEIAFCLSEVLAIAEQTDVESATAAVRDEGLLNRKHRLSCGVWQFSAVGVLPIENANPELLSEAIGAGKCVAVRTILEGSFELEFGGMGYSFSPQDAFWMQEKLLELSQQIPKQYPRVGLLKAAEAAVAGVRG
jgi:hypothetical protein